MDHLDLGDGLIAPDVETFIATYNPKSCDDPVALVETYYAVQAYRTEHDQAGPTTLEREFDVSSGRVSGWLYADARPQPVNAIETIREREWYLTEAGPDTNRAVGFATLLAWIFAAGSIGSTYQPLFFAPDETSKGRLYWAGRELGVTFRHVERASSDQYLPSDDATVLGRVLFASGAPQGRKADQEPSLPRWLVSGPDRLREAALSTIVSEAMSPHPRHGAYQLDEDRLPDSFLEELGALVGDVTDGGVTRYHGRFGLDEQASADIQRLIEHRDGAISA